MFSGLIQETGTVVSKERARVWVQMRSKKAKIGHSVAVNGACLTVARKQSLKSGQKLLFEISPETINQTTFRLWKKGLGVNIEHALSASDLLGGHIVQGHVDQAGVVNRIEGQNGSWLISFTFTPSSQALIVEKGSICVNGISLTCFDVGKDNFSVAIIPYTFENTTFQYLKSNMKVNLEFDILGKYMQRMMSSTQ